MKCSAKTHSHFSPWIIVQTNDKKTARLESIRYVLSTIPYENKKEAPISLHPNPKVVMLYYSGFESIDK